VNSAEQSFAYLGAMTDDFGTFEHADGAAPRREHGYCTDDMARLLVVAARQAHPSDVVRDLARRALRFVAEAQGVRGDCLNRRDSSGQWHGEYSVEDCWGRSLWGFGTAAARSPDDLVRRLALAHFERGARQRSPWARATAFAALGASEVITAYPKNGAALGLLRDVVETMGHRGATPSWPWPEQRLSYANAVLPDSWMAVGVALGRQDLIHEGLALLTWLLGHETSDGHLSVTPAGGSSLGDSAPAFDQQPIEVGALGDAFARAAALDPDGNWLGAVDGAIDWFLGDNDIGVVMWNAATGGGYDGLTAGGPNLNQGTESTLALISTMQHGVRFARSQL
jgi:hypothetical protein